MVIYGNAQDSQEQREGFSLLQATAFSLVFTRQSQSQLNVVCSHTVYKYIVLAGFPGFALLSKRIQESSTWPL